MTRRRAWRLGLALAAALLLAALAWAWTPDADRADLEARYSRGPQDFVVVDGLRLHVRDSGPPSAQSTGTAVAATAAPPPLLLLHGFGASLHTWEPWIAALAPTRRVIAIDLPGAGLTGADPRGDYSDERGLQILLGLLDHLGLPQVDLGGHSMGGRLAWRLAAEHPQRVRRLVLVAPDGFASPGFDYDRAPEVPALAALMRYSLPRSVLRLSLEPAYADPARIDEATLTRYHDMMRAPTVRSALLERMGQVVLREPTPMLRRIVAPTLLLWGEQDAMIPLANARDYLRTLPDARLVSLPGVGHLPHEEAPAAALPALRAFLAD